ncbi:MAG: hypothetical protein H8E62_01360 [Planctomycetes bacterium]|nr:hypothetical protein [Planctomycetota bacterium]
MLVGMIVFITLLVQGKGASGVVLGVLFLGFIVFVLLLRFSFPWWPIGLRHSCYVAKNEDMYTPVILEPFDFMTKGISASYLPNLEYWNEYSVGIRLSGGDFPEDFCYNGKIQVEFYYDEKLIDTYISEDVVYHKYYRSEGDKLKLVNQKVGLITFDVSAFRKYRDKLKIKVSVIEPDKELKAYGDNLCLYIGIDRLL